MSPHYLPIERWPARVAAALRGHCPGLWCSRIPEFHRPRIAIVGSRKASEAACNFAHMLGVELATRGVDVVSGGALGIDNAAHAGALAAGGCTWMVLGTAFADAKPKGKYARLLPDILEHGGVVVSQFPATHRGGFLARNRTLVALVDAVVVVQAIDAGSGTTSTARHAYELEVPCLVLPGPVWDADFTGSRAIVAQGHGRWIRDTDELNAALELALTLRAEAPWDAAEAPDPRVAALFNVLDRQPRHIDWLSEHSQLKMAELSAALLTLSLKNVVKEGPAGFWALGPT